MIDDILRSPDFSLDEIDIRDYLDKCSFKDRENALRQVLNKLSPKGMLTLIGTDIGVLTKLIHTNQIDVGGANQILENITSMDYISNVDRWFYNNGFKIFKKNIEGFGQYTLSVKHNE